MSKIESLRDERDALMAEVARLKDQNAILCNELYRIGPVVSRKELHTRIATLEAALKRYGQHNGDCPIYDYKAWERVRPNCTCGLDDALRKALDSTETR